MHMPDPHLTGWARTHEGAASCVHTLFEDQATRLPDLPAVMMGEQKVSYAELNFFADLLARRLRELGVGADVRVAISLERSIEMIVAVLAVLKAGGCYVPLDPAYPRERLAFMLEDSAPAAIITERAGRERFAGARMPVIVLDEPANTTVEKLPATLRSPELLAYLLFTSGSTGRPKAVAMPHGPLLNLLHWHRRTLPLAPGARVLQFAPLSFDVSFQEIFTTLGEGGTLVLIGDDLRRDPEQLLACIARHGVSRLFLPFVALQQLADAVAEGATLPSTLRDVITAGEQLQVTDAVRNFFARQPGVRLHNHYGPTETHVVTALTLPEDPATWPALPSIGCAIDETVVHLLDENRQPVGPGATGEIFIAGAAVARGYLNRPEVTAERFLADPAAPGRRMYKTGDLGRLNAQGEIEYLGRADDQVKIRGHRVELGEVENALRRHPAVRDCAVAARLRQDEKILVAYILPRHGTDWTAGEVHEFMRRALPDAMVPVVYQAIDRLPLTPSGKLDRRALPDPTAAAPAPAAPREAFATETERQIAGVWERVLGAAGFGATDSFFAVGGTSLRVAEVRRRLRNVLGRDVPIPLLFQFPTIRQLARQLDDASAGAAAASRTTAAAERATRKISAEAHAGIAIVGLAGRFPGAGSPREFWENLCAGRESIATFSDAELRAASIPPGEFNDPAYVRRRAVLDEPAHFDAAFFGFTPRDAELTDPQQRIFLECCWEALEDAGHVPRLAPGSVGVFASAGLNTYWLRQVLGGAAGIADFTNVFQADGYNILVGADKDYLATRVAFKLDLRGPALTVQTACSSSLVAIAQACASLQTFQCDAALAGGVSVSFPQERGHLYQEGAIASADGTCRAFDADARGTVFGAGCGVVLLKRVDDAIRDGNPIYGVIRGIALNNDGAGKMSYSAPSQDGQAEVIALAQALAGTPADTISYVEAHGTGTPLGDPIEVAALTQAFRASTDRVNFCGLGSVKTNVGHLEAAAGAAGLIKVALALHHRHLPATLHFRAPNPNIDFARSPFAVVDRSRAWENVPLPRRAGVSSFGVGGTNAHAIVEEAPSLAPTSASTRPQLLVLSAKTPSALAAQARRLADFLAAPAAPPLADAALTLQRGRETFEHRRAFVVTDPADAIAKLRETESRAAIAGQNAGGAPEIVFLFPGQGAQRVGMGRELYEGEPVFRAEFDRCAQIIEHHLGYDLRRVLFATEVAADEAAARLNQTQVAQPALFAIEYALARLWQSWGVEPAVLLGHSVGEYACAVLAGVFTLEDALALLARRARLIQALPPGAMMAVRAAGEELQKILPAEISVAAYNSGKLCTLSGPTAALRDFHQELQRRKIPGVVLATSHAFHSAMMEPIVAEFTAAVAAVRRAAPQRRWLSSCTGDWITADEATDPAYWARQLRQPVRFADAWDKIAADPRYVALEVGPGQALGQIARQHPERPKLQVIAASLEPVAAGEGELIAVRRALARLWVAGFTPDWQNLHGGEKRRMVSLPTYPFERRRYWAEPALSPTEPAAAESAPATRGVAVRASPLPAMATGEVEEVVLQELSAMQNQLRLLMASRPGR